MDIHVQKLKNYEEIECLMNGDCIIYNKRPAIFLEQKSSGAIDVACLNEFGNPIKSYAVKDDIFITSEGEIEVNGIMVNSNIGTEHYGFRLYQLKNYFEKQ